MTSSFTESPGYPHPFTAAPQGHVYRSAAPQTPQRRTAARLRWVASPPPGAVRLRRAVPVTPYAGPPSYPTTPRWGFPNLVWRRPTTVPGTASGRVRPIERIPVLAQSLATILWTFAALAVIAAGAEIWRYVLLVQSRNSALNTDVVAFSDAFVVTAGLLTTIMSLLPAGLSVWWLLVARQAAAEQADERPARPVWQVLVGILVPLANLPLALSVVGELEHSVLRRPRDERPKPSRLVLVWWAVWLVNWVLLAATIIWRTHSGVQAMADSVVLVALTDLAAAGLAIATALVIRRLSRLLIPIATDRLREMRVLKVDGAPEPQLRTARPVGAAR
ncbi:DUF4328 domain-containing protein [Amycolatopsis panacis]|uniref:DUF4328 domain-containing protein n=1 Tax=Amycolatopsis panacis TaxID=2340917 RepID=A0A419IAK0_9PSEU|nr:DUF4328 domain-containing protein [Amycolatopsis panacis]RJQ90722.1 DUF4328 domain-containing protein [Amycolatopsis panacis]